MSSLSSLLSLALPLLYLCGSVWVFATGHRIWTVAQLVAGAALASAVGAAFAAFVVPAGVDAPGLVMAVLVSLLGWVIVRFSSRYLTGEPGQRRFAGALLFTLAAVAVVITTHHLAVLVAAWAASSLGLHALLTFYHDRPAAQIVAHKKFLVSRMAELCLLAALALIYSVTGSLRFDGIGAAIAAMPTAPVALQIGAALIALAVILKSAQLPLHGWLIQVMEAPTPVSALLHAGVVNIGGFVLIRLAELFAVAPVAQALLVVVGTLTAVLAGLVMMTRVSIKVRLAWSTCAQMGFMLMECGLGLYELALLHLVAHSLYKAYAFLTAGETVAEARRSDLAPAIGPLAARGRVWRRLAAPPLALALVVGSVALWSWWVPQVAIPLVALVLVGLGLAPLLWAESADGRPLLASGLLRILALTQLYVLWHLAFAGVLSASAAPPLPLALWTGAAFIALYLLQLWLLAHPDGAVSRRLYPLAYAGFYLDERFTRLTFRVWPARVGTHVGPAAAPGHPHLSGESA